MKSIHDLQYERFKKWLQDKPDGEIIGFSQSVCGCPLALHLAELNCTACSVGRSTYSIGYETFRFMPKWGARFIDKVDAMQTPLTKEYLLGCLNWVEVEIG